MGWETGVRSGEALDIQVEPRTLVPAQPLVPPTCCWLELMPEAGRRHLLSLWTTCPHPCCSWQWEVSLSPDSATLVSSTGELIFLCSARTLPVQRFGVGSWPPGTE